MSKRFPHVAPDELIYFVMAAYNWGIGKVRKTGCTTWDCLKERLPPETAAYIPRIVHLVRTGEWI